MDLDLALGYKAVVPIGWANTGVVVGSFAPVQPTACALYFRCAFAYFLFCCGHCGVRTASALHTLWAHVRCATCCSPTPLLLLPCRAAAADRCCVPPNRYNFDIHVDVYFIDTKHNSTNNNTEDNTKYLYAPFIAGMRTRSPAFSFSVPVGNSGASVAPGGSTFYYKIQVSLTCYQLLHHCIIVIVMDMLSYSFRVGDSGRVC